MSTRTRNRLSIVVVILLPCLLGSRRAPVQAEKLPGPELPGEKGKPVLTMPSGIKYVILEEGTGEKSRTGQRVAFEATIWTLDGKEMESTKGQQPQLCPIGQHIFSPIMEQLLLDMKLNERRKIFVPRALGLGDPAAPEQVWEIKLTQLTGDAAVATAPPVLDPAMLSARYGSVPGELWLLRYTPEASQLAGGPIYRGPDQTQMHGFSVSGDGSRIALAMADRGLWLLDPAGAVVQYIDMTEKLVGPKPSKYSAEPSVMDVSFGPFNDRVALCLRFAGGDQTWLADYSIATGALTIISPECAGPAGKGWDPQTVMGKSGMYYGNPAISPDGKRIAFAQGREVFCADYPAMTNREQLTGAVDRPSGTGATGINGTFGCSKLRWSPDGQQIAACLTVRGPNVADQYVLYVLKPGTPAQVLCSFAGFGQCPTWCNDGSLVIAERYGPRNQERLHRFSASPVGGFVDLGCQELSPGVPVDLLLATRLQKPVATEATLVVRSTGAPCKIYLDGQLTGKMTPSTFTVKPGSHKLEVRDALGNSRTRDAFATPGQTAEVVFGP